MLVSSQSGYQCSQADSQQIGESSCYVLNLHEFLFYSGVAPDSDSDCSSASLDVCDAWIEQHAERVVTRRRAAR